MSNKLFIFGMAVTCLCGFSTKGFATTNSFKAPAGTDTVCQVPYAENFNDASKVLNPNSTCDYKGWTIFGANGNTKRFKVRVNSTLKPAGDGSYLVNNTVYGARNDWAISPAISMKGGKQYTVSCKILATGGSNSLKESIKITAGLDTTETAQSTVILDLPSANYKEWTTVSGEFTPTADGNYYIGFNNYTPQRGYIVAIDDISVTTAESNEAVASFTIPSDGIFTDKKEMILYPDNALTFTNNSQNATSYMWTTGANPGTSDEKNPTVNFPASGLYTITLKASNESSESSASEELAVKLIDAEYSGDVTTVGSKDEVNAEALKFSTASMNTNYKVGFNKYYNKFAEKFVLPENAEAVVSGFKFNINTYATGYLMTQKDYAVNVKIVGDKDGLPDETKEFGKVSTTEIGLFGNASVSNSTLNVKLTSPISVAGTFHVVFDIDSSLENDLTNYLSFSSFYHASENTTFSVYVKKGVLSGVEEGWNNVFNITKNDEDKKLGWNVGAVMTLKPYVNSGIQDAKNEDVAVKVADGVIKINGISDATDIAIYNILGAKLYQTTATDSLTVDASNFADSICIVKVGNKSFKVLVK